ncbi:MAG TPA: SRPBCC domain-containing protein [Jatrophihabitantaceae bacterium]|nr:SRPBCC domain-containing protein [Jatrophihabitantaceae bacterium]
MTALRKEVTLTRVVKAPRELVFRAWTEPELLVQWWGPRGVTSTDCEIDPRVGGTIRVTMVAGSELGESAGERWPMRGVFTEVVPPEKLVFTDEALDDAGTVLLDGVTTVLFEDLGDGTTQVTVHATGEGRSDQALPALEGMTQGWTETLDKLAEFAVRS